MTTYRLQFQSQFTLADACEVLPYLAALGVTDCYSSPLFQARPGSTHGYDVAEHDRISAELGGEEAFAAFAMALSAAGLGHVLDIVPNHMSNDPDTNPWWRDVLENGPSSPFADYFDIDWDPVKPELHNRLLVPTLRTQYGEALESGELQLVLEEATLALRHGEQCLPINPRQAPVVFGQDLDRLTARLPDDDPHLREFLSILTALRNLPAYTERDPDQVVERQREKRVARERLARLLDESAEIRGHMDAVLARFNGVVGEPASFDLLHELLEGQAYRLASWRTASDEINYRRFFDINELAGLRVERPEVFDHTHAFVLGLVRQGLVTGLRIDHVDGLFDPAGYLDRLQQEARRPHDADPTPGGLYVVVEKILATGESLPTTWATHGTTGYDFMNDVLGIFVDTRNRAAMRRVYERFTNERSAFADLTYESKQLIALTSLAGELNLLAHALNRISERNRRTRDFTLNSCHKALLEVVSCFPVYRTYVGPDGATASDQEIVDMALASARRRNPAMESSIFDFVRSALVPPPARLTDQQPADEGRETERILVRHEVPAVHGARAGQGRRGHRLLPVPRADGAQRGRR